ncbi:MAG: hypothetical protein JOS17DRAFT_77842 [Linnemannia elongata]|nr:MAG: hypothetical protein JOS17DRAFT_77842 [Linnemannia elongata]
MGKQAPWTGRPSRTASLVAPRPPVPNNNSSFFPFPGLFLNHNTFLQQLCSHFSSLSFSSFSLPSYYLPSFLAPLLLSFSPFLLRSFPVSFLPFHLPILLPIILICAQLLPDMNDSTWVAAKPSCYHYYHSSSSTPDSLHSLLPHF